MSPRNVGTARGLVAWAAMLAGFIFLLVDIVRLNIDGLAVLAVALIAFALWLLGVFTREFWVGTQPAPSSLDSKYEHRKAMDR